MNDDFLYRFRTEPSPEFASRLKARLDASVSTRKRGLRWGVFTLIFGAALAFALPAVRQSISRLVGMETKTEQVAPAPASHLQLPTPSVSKAPEVPPSAPTESEAPASTPPTPPVPPLPSLQAQTPAAEEHSEMNPLTGEFGFIAHVPPMPVIAEEEDRSGEAVPHTSTMLDEEHEALMVRRSLFRVMGWATDDLGKRVHGGLTRNWDAVIADARLLRQLAPMIPEVFHLDTRGFGLETRALPLVWRDPQGFHDHIARLDDGVEYLEEKALARDFPRTLRAIKFVIASCDACHTRYRRNDPPGSAQ